MAPTLRGSVTTATSNGTSYTVSRPTGLLAGETLLAFQSADTGDGSQMAAPTGGAPWQLLTQLLTEGMNTKVWWKLAGASEPVTYGLTQSSNADGVCAVAAVTGAGAATPLFATGTGGTGSNVITPGLVPAGLDDLELRWAASIGGSTLTWTPPSTYVERADLRSNAYTSGTLATKSLTSGAATGPQTFTASAVLTGASRHGITVAVSSSGGLVLRATLVQAAALSRAGHW